MTQRKAAIYCRTSTTEQALSLRSQERHCREKANALGYDIVAVVHEQHSGGVPLKDRPKGGPLWERYIAEEFDTIIAYDVDRTSRARHEDPAIFDAFEFVLMEGTGPQAELLVGIKHQVGKYERALIRERIVRAQRENWRAGNLATGVAPFGIRWDNDAKRWGIDEKEAALVRDIFNLSVAGQSQQGIADTLNERGIAPPSRNEKNRERSTFKRKARWWPTTVGKYLRNPAYKGTLPAYNGEFLIHAPGVDISEWPDALKVEREDFPQIVSEQVWRDAQSARSRRTKRKKGTTTFADKWTGRVMCGCCGLRFRGRPNYNLLADGKPGSNHEVRRFVCPGRLKISLQSGWLSEEDWPCRNERMLWEHELEQLVAEDVIGRFQDPKVLAEAVDLRLREMDEEARTLEAELGPRLQDAKQLDGRLTRLREMYEWGDVTAAQYHAKKAEVEADRAELARLIDGKEERLARLRELQASREQITAARDRLASLDVGYWDLAEAEQMLMEEWALDRGIAGNPSALDAVMRALDLKVVVWPDSVEVRGTLPALPLVGAPVPPSQRPITSNTEGLSRASRDRWRRPGRRLDPPEA